MDAVVASAHHILRVVVPSAAGDVLYAYRDLGSGFADDGKLHMAAGREGECGLLLALDQAGGDVLAAAYTCCAACTALLGILLGKLAYLAVCQEGFCKVLIPYEVIVETGISVRGYGAEGAEFSGAASLEGSRGTTQRVGTSRTDGLAHGPAGIEGGLGGTGELCLHAE